MQTLTEEQIHEKLDRIPEWSGGSGSIQRTYQFKDFVASMAFVNQIADAAEASEHHPDILIRYNKVTLTLSTHDAGGVTEKDFDLASKADDISGA
ncbi:MAG: 4a-hydroxytetrahydrobiopterin dehydratase [Phycisphaeraceae bacterium]|nr:MAG: 4a-hydroxytetrahydrobiopterin dehydratase [Phycisphaeraceae bacterium]